jgi:hypothetical protein
MGSRSSKIIKKLKNDFDNRFIEVDSSYWKFEVMTEGMRSQVVDLVLRDQFYSDKNISRFVAFSRIGPVTEGFDFESVLRLNSKLDVGTVAIEDLKNEDNINISYLVFKASHLVKTADYPEIYELIKETGEWADRLEEKIYSKDTQ